MTVSPTLATPYTTSLVWTITVTPVGGPASGPNVTFTTGTGPSNVGCIPACSNTDTSHATWYLADPFATSVVLQAITYYGGMGTITSQVTVTNDEVSCPSCLRTATVQGPAGTFSVQATPATAEPGSNVHVVITATNNQPLDIYVTSRLPAGLGPMTNVTPAGTWYPAQNQMQWNAASVVQQVISYDTQVTAAAGTSLTIQNWFGSPWFFTQQQDVTVTSGTPPPPPPPPGPVATPEPPGPVATSTPQPTATASPSPSRTKTSESVRPSRSPRPTSSGSASPDESAPPDSPAEPVADPLPPGLIPAALVGASGVLGAAGLMVFKGWRAQRRRGLHDDV